MQRQGTGNSDTNLVSRGGLAGLHYVPPMRERFRPKEACWRPMAWHHEIMEMVHPSVLN